MTSIDNNTEVAKMVASKIALSLDNLSGTGVITADTQTTISGNTKAQEAITDLSDVKNSILKAVGQASTNLQSVASEFEAVDKELRGIFESPIPMIQSNSKPSAPKPFTDPLKVGGNNG